MHRLVAQAFIPNPSKFPQVNHKDEDKRNNHVTNLEWCSQKYNSAYGTRGQRIAEKLSISVVQLDKEGNFLAEFESITEAAKITDVVLTSICKCCRHEPRHKSAGGFIFIYKDEYLNTQIQQDK